MVELVHITLNSTAQTPHLSPVICTDSNTFICLSNFSRFNCFKTSLKTFRVLKNWKKTIFIKNFDPLACFFQPFFSLLYFFLSQISTYFHQAFPVSIALEQASKHSLLLNGKWFFFIKAVIFLLALSSLSLLFFSSYLCTSHVFYFDSHLGIHVISFIITFPTFTQHKNIMVIHGLKCLFFNLKSFAKLCGLQLLFLELD